MGIRKRGKAWLVTVELGTDERGVRRRKCVSCASEGDAKRVEANLTSEVLSGTYVEPSTATVAEFLDEWRSHAGRGRAQRTRDHYEITCEKHLKPALGRVKLAQLKPLHISSSPASRSPTTPSIRASRSTCARRSPPTGSRPITSGSGRRRRSCGAGTGL
jgi:hypothetical protein